MMNRSFLFLAFLSCAIMAQSSAPAQSARDSVDLGVIHPHSSYEQSVIHVASFNVGEESGTTFESIPRVIRHDLELTGLFKMPSDMRMCTQQNMRDGKSRGVDFGAWVKLGVEQYVMGRVERNGDQMKVRILLYDIPGSQLIFERYFTGPSADERGMAHRISDEIVHYTKGMDGVAQTKLLFVTEQVPNIKEIAMSDWDGFNPRALTKYNNICTSPEWGANGTEFYFGSYHGNRGNLYGEQVSSGQVWTIAGYGGTNHSPSWCQSTKRLALVLSKDGNSEIYSSTRDGSDLQRVTKTPTTEGSPCWSPDGKRLAFVCDGDKGVHIYTMNADGSARTRLTPMGSWNDAPSWAPDGTRIVFVSRAKGVNDVFICDMGTSPATFRRLTENQGQNASPEWAPNGHHIVFSSNRSGAWQNYIMLDDGSAQQQVTTSGKNTQPSWGPQPPQAANQK